MPPLNLYLSSDKPWKASYTTEDGVILYKTETHSHITKISYAARPRGEPEGHATNAQASESDPQGLFTYLAEVEYHTFRTSRIRYAGFGEGATGVEGEAGKGKPVDEIFRKSGWAFYGRNRIFTAPDGKEYKWVLGSGVCKLVAKDGKKTPMATFHKEKFGFTQKSRRPAYFEIFEAGAQMTDLILITFIYVEMLRREREETTEAAG